MNTVVEEKVTARYWATVKDGEIACLAEGYPEQVLCKDQIALSKKEWYFLHSIKVSLKDARWLIKAISHKVSANGS